MKLDMVYWLLYLYSYSPVLPMRNPISLLPGRQK